RPRRTPGQTNSQAFPFAGLAGHIDDAADDVAAEVPIACADADALAVPAVHDRGGRVSQRHQARFRVGAADGYEAFAPDVLLAEHGEIVLFSTRRGRLVRSCQPRRQGVAASAGGQPDAPTGAVERGGGAESA